jgi:hypothetical protein
MKTLSDKEINEILILKLNDWTFNCAFISRELKFKSLRTDWLTNVKTDKT